MKTPKISLSDFSFLPSGFGHYKVTYTSPITGKQWGAVTNDMPLIDETKNADFPKVKDLERLKRVCKYNPLRFSEAIYRERGGKYEFVKLV